MSKQPQVWINWKKVGGRKFVAAFIAFLTAIINTLAGNAMNLETLTLAILGFITFMIVEGIIDFRAVANGKKATVSGELKKRLAVLEEMLEHVKAGALKPHELPDTKPPIDEG